MLKQKAKDKHLNVGDCNSKYFYSMINARKKRSTIQSFEDAYEIPVTDPVQFENVLVSHFKEILAPGSYANLIEVNLRHICRHLILAPQL